ncbi:dienelactone hydrolase family protein [Arsenicicoccus dermatophilus]|uniref:dienelactone hydrolase family protein n=1 Tax=Arsenicicoccus dermatophilus TaxID=1076331 RepID=UPI003916EBA1
MATLREIDLTMPDGVCDAYLARPDEPGPHAPVLLIMDAIGLRPRIAEIALRLADDGYAVLAPNVYHRVGRQPLLDPALMSDARTEERHARIVELLGTLTTEDWDEDGPVYLAHLRALGEIGDEDVRVVGYCMGGALALRLAARCPDEVSVVCGFHAGHLVTADADSPHLLLEDVEARLYFGFADEDATMTAAEIETLRLAAEDAGCDYEGEVYPGARHGFTMSDLPAYDARATERHWEALLQVFDEA